MVEVRIPGLDHSLMQDGSWAVDEDYHRLADEQERIKRSSRKREASRVREQNSGQVRIGDDVAAW